MLNNLLCLLTFGILFVLQKWKKNLNIIKYSKSNLLAETTHIKITNLKTKASTIVKLNVLET